MLIVFWEGSLSRYCGDQNGWAFALDWDEAQRLKELYEGEGAKVLIVEAIVPIQVQARIENNEGR